MARLLVGALRGGLGLGALLLLAACGGEQAGEAGGSRPATTRARWTLPALTPAEQARYALERLLRGPAPHEALPLPLSHHDHALKLAKLDLVTLSSETESLLSDPATIARVTDPSAGLSGWQSVLEVLGGLPSPDPALVLRWTRGAAAVPQPTLHASALVPLARVRDPRAGGTLLELLEAGADDRSNSREALAALARLPGDWLARALVVVLERGAPEAWLSVAGALEAAVEADESARARVDGWMAWWALLAEPTGPRPSSATPRTKSLPFAALPRDLGPGSPGWVAAAPGVRAVGPWSGRVVNDLGWLPTSVSADACTPLYALWLVGREPAADTRCALALTERPAYVAAVLADRRGADPLLAARARHCMLAGERGLTAAERIARVDAFLARLRDEGVLPEVEDLRDLARVLPAPQDDASVACLVRILEQARPVAHMLWFLEEVFDLLASGGTEAELDCVRRLLGDAQPESRGLGLHLAHRARDPALLPALERVHEAATPEGRAAVRRTLVWIYAGGRTPPGALERFVPRFQAWIDEAGDAQASSLAPGLLELGDVGVEAFVALLSGPRQGLIVRRLAAWPGVLPTVVAEALADRLSADLPAELRQAVLETLWRSAPADAAGAIAAAKPFLDPRDRPAVDAVLEVVRHRAARP